MTRTIPLASRLRLAVPALALALSPACASLRPPARTSGPVTSVPAPGHAVEIAVVGQDCSESPNHSYPEESLGETIVEVRVRNDLPDAVTLRRDAFRLVTSDGYALITRTWGAADPLQLAHGETRSFRLRFMARGSLRCDSELSLETRDGVHVGPTPVHLDAVRFVPRRPSPDAASSSTSGAT